MSSKAPRGLWASTKDNKSKHVLKTFSKKIKIIYRRRWPEKLVRLLKIRVDPSWEIKMMQRGSYPPPPKFLTKFLTPFLGPLGPPGAPKWAQGPRGSI